MEPIADHYHYHEMNPASGHVKAADGKQTTPQAIDRLRGLASGSLAVRLGGRLRRDAITDRF